MQKTNQIKCLSYRDGPIRFFILFLVCLIVFGVQYAFDIPQALEESLQTRLNITETQFNMLYTVFAGASVLTAIVFGYLIDRVGSRIMIISLAVSVALFQYLIAIGGYVGSYSIILCGRILLGLVCQSLISVQLTIVSQWFRGKQLSLAMGLALTSPELGDALNSILSPKIYQSSHSLGTPILVSALICTIGIFAAILVAYIDLKADQADQAKNLQYYSSKSSYDDEEEMTETIQCKDIIYFKYPFWLLCFISTLSLAIYVPFLDNGNRLLQKRFCYSQIEAGKVLMATYIISALISPIIGMIVDKVGAKRYFIFFSSAIFIIAHGIILILPQCQYNIVESGAVIGYLLLGFGYSLYANCIVPAIPLMVHKKYTGTAFGILLMMQNTALAIFPLISGAIVQSTPQPQLGYINSSLFFFIVSIVSFIVCFGLFFMTDHYKNKLDATKTQLQNRIIIKKGVEIQITSSQIQSQIECSVKEHDSPKLRSKLLDLSSQ